jgi:beta-lactamase regulating signal transducer with metallopeptidase domain/peptidoglycan/xylan/chitin deacetylase (PgdA/CDA1 family)
MNWEIFAGSKLVENLGWTLIHSIWQIALIGAILFALLRLLTSLSANARHILAVSALALSFLIPVITFVQISGNPASSSLVGTTANRARFERGEAGDPHRDALTTAAAVPQAANAEAGGSLLSFAAIQKFIDTDLASRLPFTVGLWLIGMAFFALRLLGGIWQLHRFRTRATSAPEAAWQERFTQLCERLNISQRVKLLTSNLVDTPIVVGWLKPLILVPAGLFLQIDPRQLEIILAHELVHIRRWDPLINLGQSAAEVLFFYHPFIWWISAVIRKEREFAADACVLQTFNDSSVVYANALANLEEIRLLTNRPAPSLATAANGGNLMQRIQRILQKNTGRSSANSAWSAALAVLLIPAVLTAIFSFNSSLFVNAQNKVSKDRKIAIGFVGLPPVDRSENPPKDADATARLVIAKLTQHKVPAVGFVTGGMISDGEKLYPVRANIVRLWRDAGLEVGIGNFKHIWFYDTPYEEYVAGVEKNAETVKKILAEKNLPLRYFSYPYLNTGKSVEERDRFDSWLAARGIRTVKYTIDNNEWMYSYAYDMARNDNDVNTMNEVRTAFIAYMSRVFDHFEAYSTGMFGRDINQTMVLTPSRLIADSADDLFGMIEKRGYKFVSVEEALGDEAYKTPESFIGKSGISWFERWTLAAGKPLRDEPMVDGDIQKVWEKSRAKSK